MKKLSIRNSFLILFLFIIGLPLALNAQSSDETIYKMNSIKMDESLIFGEAYNSTENTAYDNALSDLLSYVNELRFENGTKQKITINDIRPFVKQLSHFDGKQYNILLYVPKSQTVLMESDSNMSKPYTNTTSKNTNIESVVQTKSQSTNKERANSSANNQSVEDRSNTSMASDILETLCAQDNWTEIKGFLSAYKNKGRLKDYGFSTDISEIPIDSYRILIDNQYGILAILAPKNSDYRINIKTNQFDKESNYPNCAVIVWFK